MHDEWTFFRVLLLFSFDIFLFFSLNLERQVSFSRSEHTTHSNFRKTRAPREMKDFAPSNRDRGGGGGGSFELRKAHPLAKPGRTHERPISGGGSARRARSCFLVLRAWISYLRGTIRLRIVECESVDMWCFLLLLSFNYSNFRRVVFMLPTGTIWH